MSTKRGSTSDGEKFLPSPSPEAGSKGVGKKHRRAKKQRNSAAIPTADDLTWEPPRQNKRTTIRFCSLCDQDSKDQHSVEYACIKPEEEDDDGDVKLSSVWVCRSCFNWAGEALPAINILDIVSQKLEDEKNAAHITSYFENRSHSSVEAIPGSNIGHALTLQHIEEGGSIWQETYDLHTYQEFVDKTSKTPSEAGAKIVRRPGAFGKTLTRYACPLSGKPQLHVFSKLCAHSGLSLLKDASKLAFPGHQQMAMKSAINAEFAGTGIGDLRMTGQTFAAHCGFADVQRLPPNQRTSEVTPTKPGKSTSAESPSLVGSNRDGVPPQNEESGDNHPETSVEIAELNNVVAVSEVDAMQVEEPLENIPLKLQKPDKPKKSTEKDVSLPLTAGVQHWIQRSSLTNVQLGDEMKREINQLTILKGCKSSDESSINTHLQNIKDNISLWEDNLRSIAKKPSEKNALFDRLTQSKVELVPYTQLTVLKIENEALWLDCVNPEKRDKTLETLSRQLQLWHRPGAAGKPQFSFADTRLAYSTAAEVDKATFFLSNIFVLNVLEWVGKGPDYEELVQWFCVQAPASFDMPEDADELEISTVAAQATALAVRGCNVLALVSLGCTEQNFNSQTLADLEICLTAETSIESDNLLIGIGHKLHEVDSWKRKLMAVSKQAKKLKHHMPSFKKAMADAGALDASPSVDFVTTAESIISQVEDFNQTLGVEIARPLETLLTQKFKTSVDALVGMASKKNTPLTKAELELVEKYLGARERFSKVCLFSEVLKEIRATLTEIKIQSEAALQNDGIVEAITAFMQLPPGELQANADGLLKALKAASGKSIDSSSVHDHVDALMDKIISTQSLPEIAPILVDIISECSRLCRPSSQAELAACRDAIRNSRNTRAASREVDALGKDTLAIVNSDSFERLISGLGRMLHKVQSQKIGSNEWSIYKKIDSVCRSALEQDVVSHSTYASAYLQRLLDELRKFAKDLNARLQQDLIQRYLDKVATVTTFEDLANLYEDTLAKLDLKSWLNDVTQAIEKMQRYTTKCAEFKIAVDANIKLEFSTPKSIALNLYFNAEVLKAFKECADQTNDKARQLRRSQLAVVQNNMSKVEFAPSKEFAQQLLKSYRIGLRVGIV